MASNEMEKDSDSALLQNFQDVQQDTARERTSDNHFQVNPLPVHVTGNDEAIETKEEVPTLVKSEEPESEIKLNAEFSSFLQLRNAIDKYQREKSVQLIVKDSKLLKAESTRKIIPKVYHLVNQDLMYHSITYICKCHGELKQKQGTRIKIVGQKRLNCPMFIRLKLSPNLQTLMLFDLHEEHNHDKDPTTFQMTPRQQLYQLSRLSRKRIAKVKEDLDSEEITAVSGESDATSQCTPKVPRVCPTTSDEDCLPKEGSAVSDSESSIDSDSSCTDSDEEDIRNNRHLLPFPARLIGSAITCNPELVAITKDLLETQKEKVKLQKQLMLKKTRLLELSNQKLELEVKQLQRALAEESVVQQQDTTIYLQT